MIIRNFNYIKKIIKKNNKIYIFCLNFKYIIKHFYYKILGLLFYNLKVRHNKIVILNYCGRDYGDNAKYLCDKLLKKFKGIDIVWLTKNLDSKFPKGIRKVKYGSIKAIYELNTAKIWINNCRFQWFLFKKKNQIYFQLWHGSLGIKKIEFDALNSIGISYIKYMKHDNNLIDYMVSGSDFFTDRIRKSFKYDGDIIMCGHPRDDILFHYDSSVRNKVLKYFNIDEEFKILLYAPTFRNNFDYNPYDIDEERILNLLAKKTKEKWIIINRLHPNISKMFNNFPNLINGLNGTFYPDMQELICASDLVISDYSSLMFDAMLAKKDVIIYANDVKKYIDEKGVYFTLDELPFPFANNNDELADIITKKYNYEKAYAEFLKKVNLFENGNASQILAEKIIDIIQEKK